MTDHNLGVTEENGSLQHMQYTPDAPAKKTTDTMALGFIPGSRACPKAGEKIEICTALRF